MKKRILILVETISRRSGGASSALDLAESFHDLGYDILIGVTKYPPFLLKFIKKSDTSFPFNKVGVIHQKLVDRRYKSRLGFIFYFLAKKKINMKSFDSFDYAINVSAINESLIQQIKKNRKIKIIKNHPGSIDTFKEFWMDKHLNFRDEYLKANRNYDKILFQSNFQSKECAVEFPELSDKTIVIEPTCRECEVIGSNLNQTPYNSNERLKIVNVGSVQPRKGQLLSLNLLEMLHNSGLKCELHLVGSTVNKDYLRQLEKEIIVKKLSDIIYIHGHKDNYLDYMVNSDIVLQTSYSEGVSRILREAMLLKKLIATFNISGTNDLLDNDCAVLANPFDVQELCNKIHDLSNKKNEVIRLIQNSYKKYLERNSKTVFQNNIISTFK